MKYVNKPKEEKLDKTFELELKSANGKYSTHIVIQKEVMKLLELNKGDILEIHIKEFDDVIGYDLKFKHKDETKDNNTILLEDISTDKPDETPEPEPENTTSIKNVFPDDEETEEKEYKKLKDNKANIVQNYDGTYKISIRKNYGRTKQNFHLHFSFKGEKIEDICNITYKDGSLENSCKAIFELSHQKKDEVTEFILEHNPSSKTKLEQLNLI